MRFSLTVFGPLASLLLGLTLAATASAETINCPLTEARREITTELPAGWWNTPQLKNLSATEVQVIGGESTLVCRYGNAGSVMHLAPAGATCTAVGTGFSCSGGAPAGPAVFHEGEMTLTLFGHGDLDAGAHAMSKADVLLMMSDAMAALIVPQHGARFGNPSASDPGQAGCASETLRDRPVVMADLLGGGYLCYKTNAGRIGLLEYLGAPGGPGTVSIHYTTWE